VSVAKSVEVERRGIYRGLSGARMNDEQDRIKRQVLIQSQSERGSMHQTTLRRDYYVPPLLDPHLTRPG
jgi:hypothetical protein